MASETKPKLALPWKIKLLLSAYTFAVNISRRPNGTVNRRLTTFLDLKSPPSATKPIHGVTTSDTAIDSSLNLWFRLYTPTTAPTTAPTTTSLPVIVYFHGGGFVYFSANTKIYNRFCRDLAGTLPAVVVSVNYRLAPEHRFPSQFDDALDALKFLDDAVLPPIADLSRCFIAGDSAGANIAHHAAVRAAEEEFKRVKIAGVIAVQPFFGGEKRTESELRLARVPLVSTEITDWLWRAFLPQKSDRNHEVVNVSGPKSASISGVKFPATMVVVGGFDPLQDRQRRYHGWLKKCGIETCLVEYPNAVHAFYWFPELPESSVLIRDVRDFIQKHE
ncbi:hypothetical protein ACSBR2_036313 [Camellia fascicularis]